MADLEVTPKETVVGFFKAWRAYDALPALQAYSGPMLSVVTPMNDEPFSLHNLGTGLAYTPFTGTGLRSSTASWTISWRRRRTAG